MTTNKKIRSKSNKKPNETSELPSEEIILDDDKLAIDDTNSKEVPVSRSSGNAAVEIAVLKNEVQNLKLEIAKLSPAIEAAEESVKKDIKDGDIRRLDEKYKEIGDAYKYLRNWVIGIATFVLLGCLGFIGKQFLTAEKPVTEKPVQINLQNSLRQH